MKGLIFSLSYDFKRVYIFSSFYFMLNLHGRFSLQNDCLMGGFIYSRLCAWAMFATDLLYIKLTARNIKASDAHLAWKNYHGVIGIFLFHDLLQGISCVSSQMLICV
jgi:hypothetical protein